MYNIHCTGIDSDINKQMIWVGADSGSVSTWLGKPWCIWAARFPSVCPSCCNGKEGLNLNCPLGCGLTVGHMSLNWVNCCHCCCNPQQEDLCRVCWYHSCGYLFTDHQCGSYLKDIPSCVLMPGILIRLTWLRSRSAENTYMLYDVNCAFCSAATRSGVTHSPAYGLLPSDFVFTSVSWDDTEAYAWWQCSLPTGAYLLAYLISFDCCLPWPPVEAY